MFRIRLRFLVFVNSGTRTRRTVDLFLIIFLFFILFFHGAQVARHHADDGDLKPVGQSLRQLAEDLAGGGRVRDIVMGVDQQSFFLITLTHGPYPFLQLKKHSL